MDADDDDLQAFEDIVHISDHDVDENNIGSNFNKSSQPEIGRGVHSSPDISVTFQAQSTGKRYLPCLKIEFSLFDDKIRPTNVQYVAIKKEAHYVLR